MPHESDLNDIISFNVLYSLFIEIKILTTQVDTKCNTKINHAWVHQSSSTQKSSTLHGKYRIMKEVYHSIFAVF